MWYFIIAFIFFWFGFLMCAVLSINRINDFDPWNNEHPVTPGKESANEPMDEKNTAA